MDEIRKESDKTNKALAELEQEILKVRDPLASTLSQTWVVIWNQGFEAHRAFLPEADHASHRPDCAIVLNQAEEDYFDATPHGNIVRGWDGFLDR
jgi:hypothetical protein